MSSISKTIGIYDLPTDHLFPIIFRNLPIKDILNCRLVDKLFKYFSDLTNDHINKLIVGEPDLCDCDLYWYYNNHSIEDGEIISLKCFRSIKLLKTFNLSKNLKYLKIYAHQFQLKEISNFTNLESIEFGYYNYYNYDYIHHHYTKTLKSNNLKVFASNNSKFNLYTLKLEKIQWRHVYGINLVSNLESIKHVITWKYDDKLVKLKNLEILELRNFEQFIHRDILIKFKCLKKLKINLRSLDLYHTRVDKLFKILNDKIKSNREIDIYLEGIIVENIDKLIELKKYISINQNLNWGYLLDNYDLLDQNLPFVDHLRYDYLNKHIKNIKNSLSTSFFNKFCNINHVHVTYATDIDNLNWFLNNLKYLKKLRTNCVSLNQIFYNNLPNTIKELYINNLKKINCDFILKLSKLINFKTHDDKDLFDVSLKSFSNLKYLENFEFFYRRKKIVISSIDQHLRLNTLWLCDHNQLVEECNKIRSK